MNTATPTFRPLCLILLAFTVSIASTLAQEVIIPDPGLNAAIRTALQKPNGPLTQQDLLGLTNLTAESFNITNLQGLEAAHNLSVLHLADNHLTNVTFPGGLTNLTLLDISFNSLAAIVIPADLTNLATLDLRSNQLASFNLPSLAHLDRVTISGNLLSNLTLPAGLTVLTELNAWDNQLTNLALPADMTNLIRLRVFRNDLTNLTLPANLKSLAVLDLDNNLFTRFDVSSNLSGLGFLDLRVNQLTNITFPASMTNMQLLLLSENNLTNISLPSGMSNLNTLELAGNHLTSLNLPAGLTNLVILDFTSNQLSNLALPADLTKLTQLYLGNNQLSNLALPFGLTNLLILDLHTNQLSSLTLPPDMAQLLELFIDGNPLITFVLPDPLAVGSLSVVVANLVGQGANVFSYPLDVQLVNPHMFTGAFHLAIKGPPGIYSILGSTDLVTWTGVGTISNALGAINFNDLSGDLPSRKFYRAFLQIPPTNMVFIPAGLFTMGSTNTEQDRLGNEGPQTIVSLTHGFWMGKFEVTQAEYLSIMNTNPSVFPDNLSAAVSSMTWLDATNFCAKLTDRELAAGRIPEGSHFRLPTEAEWEYAARAGTTTRFSYGNDPTYASLTNHAWFGDNSGFFVHPVGGKLPNPWGLYDMEGNVWEWCQDWFGPFPGGVQINPTGPATNQMGLKVMRGGAYDYPNSFSRSASRNFFAVSPFVTDSDLGFRVVLVTEPQ